MKQNHVSQFFDIDNALEVHRRAAQRDQKKTLIVTVRTSTGRLNDVPSYTGAQRRAAERQARREDDNQLGHAEITEMARRLIATRHQDALQAQDEVVDNTSVIQHLLRNKN